MTLGPYCCAMQAPPLSAAGVAGRYGRGIGRGQLQEGGPQRPGRGQQQGWGRPGPQAAPAPPRKRDAVNRQPGESPLPKAPLNDTRLQLRAAHQEAQAAQEAKE